MLAIDRKFLVTMRSAAKPQDLHGLLQRAIELEHATIPPYLLAAYSLQEGANSEIRRALIDMAKEEMLHMAIVANVLNALGGSPQIGGESFTPQYPSVLPMGIQSSLKVGLRKFSIELCRDVFMKIEEPETPIMFPFSVGVPVFATIGEFYLALIAKIIEQLGNAAFIGDPTRQVVGATSAGFPKDRLFPIVDVNTAVKSLRWVVEDGEGTQTKPLDFEGQLAHYYRFAEIVVGKKLVPDSNPKGYAYKGDAIVFDPASVYDFPNDPKALDHPPNSWGRGLVENFNQAYSDMLRDLHRSFNGEPSHIVRTNQNMIALRGLAVDAMSFVDEATGKRAAVSFEYMPPLTS